MKIYCDSSTTEACIVIEGSEPIVVPYDEQVTNNVGEYQAVILALKEGGRRKRIDLEVSTDSALVVNQVNGSWRCKKSHLLPFREQAQELVEKTRARLAWVPREDNLAGKVLE